MYYNPYEPWIQSLRLGPRTFPQLDPPTTGGLRFMNDYLPTSINDLEAWVDNWMAVLTAHPTDFELTAPQVTATGVKVTAFKNAVDLVLSLKDQLKAAVQDQNSKQSDMVSDLRAKGRAIIASSGITDSNKLAAGYKVRDTLPTDVIPIAVSGVAVYGTSDGINHLAWNRNGNKSGTDFNIEAQIGTSTAWVLVGHTRAVKWNHVGQTPGVQIRYRIISQRANRFSGPSNEAIVYGS